MAKKDTELDSGVAVEYRVGDKWKKGTIHAVRKVDEKRGTRVVGYLIDTGKVARKAGYENLDELPEGVDAAHAAEQPQQVDVLPEDVRLAE